MYQVYYVLAIIIAPLVMQDCHMIMTSVSGHLLTLDFVLAYKNW